MAAGNPSTGDRIVAAIQAWAERTGEPPTVREWKAEPSYPNMALVVRVSRLLVRGHRGGRIHAAPPGQAAQEGTAVSAALSRRVEKVVGYPPLLDMDDRQRREFHGALLGADSFEDLTAHLPGGGAHPADPSA